MTIGPLLAHARRRSALLVTLSFTFAVVATVIYWNDRAVEILGPAPSEAQRTEDAADSGTELGRGPLEGPTVTRSFVATEGPTKASGIDGHASDDDASDDDGHPKAGSGTSSNGSGDDPPSPGVGTEKGDRPSDRPTSTTRYNPPASTTTSAPISTTTTAAATTTTATSTTSTTTSQPPSTTTTTKAPPPPSGPPVAGTVLFTRIEPFSDTGREALWRVESDGTGLARLGWGGSPSWSPTKTRFAFELDGEINVANADGSGGHRVGPTRSDASALDFETDWSPDGTRIAFIHLASNGSELWVVGADGSNARHIAGASANGITSVRTPRWDRSGRFVRFTARPNPWTQSVGLVSIAVDGPALPVIVVPPITARQMICYVESPGAQRHAYLTADAIFMTIRVEESGRSPVEPFGTSTGLGCPHWANHDWLLSGIFDNGVRRIRFASVDGRVFDVPNLTDFYEATF